MVTERYTVVWTKRGLSNLKGIHHYIQRTNSKERADYVTQGIAKEVHAAALFPSKHRIEPHLNRVDIRFAVKWKYKILFQIRTDSILVLKIFHTAQHPKKLMD